MDNETERMGEEQMKRIIFKAKLGDGPVQVVGSYEMTQEEWEEEMESADDEETWLQNTGVDWAYEAVHSDCLEFWAEMGEE